MTLLPNRSSDYQIVKLEDTLQKRDFDQLVIFLQQHGGLDTTDEYERTALMHCMMEDSRKADSSPPYGNEFAKRLVKLGANINLKDKGGYTALHFAVQDNNLEMVDFLLAQPGLDVNILPEVIEVALHFHARDSKLLIKLIRAGNLFQGGDMTVYERIYEFQTGEVTRGDGPVDMTEVLQVLHELYPQKISHVEPFFLESIRYDFISAEFRTLLNTKNINLLLTFINEHGGVNGVDEYNRTPLINCMMAYPGFPRGSNIKKITTDLSKKLIDMHADIYVKDNDGFTALDFAMKNKNVEIGKLIQTLSNGSV